MSRIKGWKKIDEGVWQQKGSGYPILDKTVWLGSNNSVNISEGKFKVIPLYYENRTLLKRCRTSKEAHDFAINWMRGTSISKSPKNIETITLKNVKVNIEKTNEGYEVWSPEEHEGTFSTKQGAKDYIYMVLKKKMGW